MVKITIEARELKNLIFDYEMRVSKLELEKQELEDRLSSIKAMQEKDIDDMAREFDKSRYYTGNGTDDI